MKKRVAIWLILIILLVVMVGTAVATTGVAYPIMRLKANRSGDVQCLGYVDEVILKPYDGGVTVTCRVYVE